MTRHRGAGLVELAIVLLIIAAVSLYYFSRSSAPSNTTVPVAIQAQNAADITTAIAIANTAYDTDQSSSPIQPTTSIQYAAVAAQGHYVTLSGVTPTATGAEFTFSDGAPVCVSTGLNSPVTQSC